MRLYVAGPMTGIAQFNFPAFDAMASRLRGDGHDVVSPAELDDPDDRAAALASPDGSMSTYGNARADGVIKKTWGDFLARDVKLLADGGLQGVVVLPGWEISRGARLETYVARALCGLPVFAYQFGELVPLNDITMYRGWTSQPTLALHLGFSPVGAL